VGGAWFTASGNSTWPAIINGQPGGTVSLGSLPVTLNNDGVSESLDVNQATLALNGNHFTINSTSGSPFLPGTYLLINGSIDDLTGGAPYPTPVGSAIPTLAGYTASIQVTGDAVYLVITAPPCAGADFSQGYTLAGGNQSVTLGWTNLAGMQSVVGYNMAYCAFTSGTAVANGVTYPLGTAQYPLPPFNSIASFDTWSPSSVVILPPYTTNLQLTATVQSEPGAGQAEVNAQVTSVAGCTTTFDPRVASLYLSAGGEIRTVFRNVPKDDHYLSIKNGAPGLRYARVIVNGASFPNIVLTDGANQVLDISGALVAGADNTVVVEGFGTAGAGARVSLASQPADPTGAGIQVAATVSGGDTTSVSGVPDPEITQQGNQWVVSWPATGPSGEDYTAYQLQVSATGAPGSWSFVGAAPVISAGQVSVTVPAGGAAQFYQLQNPSAP
jgi:hypothetical protein